GVRWLLADAVAPVFGVASPYFFPLRGSSFGAVLGLLGGFFLYIGASDLIPESYHAHPKFLTTAMTLAGAAALYIAIALNAHWLVRGGAAGGGGDDAGYCRPLHQTQGFAQKNQSGGGA